MQMKTGSGLLRDRKVERGAAAEFRLHPHSSAALLHNAFADCQTDPGAWEFAPVQPLEDAEDLFVIARIDPDAIILNGELDRVAGVDRRNLNLRSPRPAEHN